MAKSEYTYQHLNPLQMEPAGQVLALPVVGMGILLKRCQQLLPLLLAVVCARPLSGLSDKTHQTVGGLHPAPPFNRTSLKLWTRLPLSRQRGTMLVFCCWWPLLWSAAASLSLRRGQLDCYSQLGLLAWRLNRTTPGLGAHQVTTLTCTPICPGSADPAP